MPLFKDVRYLLSEADPARVRPCAAETAFLGRSNVGKSSLVNALLGKPLAKVSQTPGRTRTINVFEAAHGRWLVDLPGYGFAVGPAAERASWGRMVEGYLERASLRSVVLAMDGEVGPTALDLKTAAWLKDRGRPVHIVMGKWDKVKPGRRQARMREVSEALGMAPEALSWVSAASGEGVQELKRILEKDLR